MTTNLPAYPNRQIGDLTVPPIGFGSMLLAVEGRPDEADAVRTVHAALDTGIRLVDTAVNYGQDASELGYNEALVAKALGSWSGDADEVLVVGKGGNLRTAEQPFIQDGSPSNLRWSCETSLKALGVDSFGLYLLHSIDPKVPLAESMGALKELKEEGKVQRVGISNAGRGQLAEAQEVVEIEAVENEFSPWTLRTLPIVQMCAEKGIAFLAYSPLGSFRKVAQLADKPAIAAAGDAHGVSPQRVALAWSLATSPCLIPIPSARRPETIRDSAAAMELELTVDEQQAIWAELTTTE